MSSGKANKSSDMATVAAAIAELITDNADSDEDTKNEGDNHMKEMLEYLDGMANDLKEIHEQQAAQSKKIQLLEERIENVNNRMDHMGGK